MFNAESYVSRLISRLRDVFDERLVYVGLQGSYLRGEAHEGSDIDIMLVIDQLNIADMDAYRRIIHDLEDPEKSCGFICSREDLSHWNPLEACHVLHSTKDLYGALSPLLPQYTRGDIINFTKYSLNNLYHEICHRYIHASREKNIAKLPYTLKGTFFILQCLHYLRTGDFISTKAQLLPLLTGRDREILEFAIGANDSDSHAFDTVFESLFKWCQETLRAL